MKNLLLLLSALLLLGCNKNLLPTGSIRQEHFTETIPFTFDSGLPIIKVTIEGIDYNFLLDTGAPTVISPELAAALHSKTVKKSIVSDSQGNDNVQEFVLINEIQIGRLQFNAIGAVVINLKKTFEIKCLNIDGIIGSNQMSNAIWEIDYKNKSITITDDFVGFKEPEGAAKINFIEMGNQKTPMVRIQVDSTRSKLLTFDTGANGSIDLPYSHFKNAIKEYKQVKSYGNSTSGVYGTGKKDTITTTKVSSIQLGTLKLNHQLLTLDDISSPLIGNAFLKNYKTTLNWKTRTIYLLQQDSVINSSVETLGLAIRYINNKAVVALLFQNSDAEKAGLQLGDEIIEIEGTNLEELTDAQACDHTFRSLLRNKKEVALTYLRNNKKQDIKIFSKVLLE